VLTAPYLKGKGKGISSSSLRNEGYARAEGIGMAIAKAALARSCAMILPQQDKNAANKIAAHQEEYRESSDQGSLLPQSSRGTWLLAPGQGY